MLLPAKACAGMKWKPLLDRSKAMSWARPENSSSPRLESWFLARLSFCRASRPLKVPGCMEPSRLLLRLMEVMDWEAAKVSLGRKVMSLSCR